MNELYEQIQAAIIADERPHGTRPTLLQILELHSPTVTTKRYHDGTTVDTTRCEYCASLCHSRSGLGCELEGDAVYPCDTVKIIAESYGIGQA